MKVTLSWLKEYINLDNISNEELFSIIGLHISEIETTSVVSSATNLLVGHVLSKEPHPDSDHLNICQVDLGSYQTQIVCGAPNVDKGQNVIVAVPGAILPGDFKIKPAKVRGIESNGMICSLQELGFNESVVEAAYHDGIYVLPADAPIGASAIEYLRLDDIIIDLELTSNRSDLLSVEGIAYDLKGYLGRDINIKNPVLKENRMSVPLKLNIKTLGCRELNMRVLRNVTVCESPLDIKLKLMASGIRPINNIVDITNLVLLELGQPLHAYDLEKSGINITVRNANEGEKLVTLDGVERTLTATDVVVANEEKALCLGGVMGGLDSMITEHTTDVLLEAAVFEPLVIRKTSQRLNLKSESSTRFERQVCQERAIRALNYCAELLSKYANAEICGQASTLVKKTYTQKIVDVTLDKINGVIGTSLTIDEVSKIFTNLGYEYTLDDNKYHITLPSRRMDLEPSYQDVIEDVCRMIGYDNIPTTTANTNLLGGLTDKQYKVRLIRQTLAALGLNETVNYSLTNLNTLFTYTLNEDVTPIKVMMPQTSDREVMRVSLVNSLIEDINYNNKRQNENVNIFEIGKVYSKEREELMLAGAFTGMFESNIWQNKKLTVDFFVVKGLIEELGRRLNVSMTFTPYKDIKKTYHPNQAAHILVGDVEVGFIAKLHPSVQKENDLKDTYVFEISLDKLLCLDTNFKYQVISKYPSIERDLAIVLDKSVTAKEVIDVVKMITKKYLEEVTVFDLYQGEGLADNEKSLAIKMKFTDKEKTLESQTVDKLISSLLNRFDFYFKARLR